LNRCSINNSSCIINIKLSADSRIFESRPVTVKQTAVLSAELNFDSDGPLRFSIKKSYGAPKKTKTTFLCPNIGVKCVFQHNIQNMTCPRIVSLTLYSTVSFVFSRKMIKTFKKMKNLFIKDLQKPDTKIFAKKGVLVM